VKPNIVLLLTDDQDEGSLSLVPGIEEAIGAAGGTGPGATFDRAFVTTPVCCPSRVSQLTGAYAHNHKVLTNFPPRGSITKFRSKGWEISPSTRSECFSARSRPCWRDSLRALRRGVSFEVSRRPGLRLRSSR
jgi:hypothetical protein